MESFLKLHHISAKEYEKHCTDKELFSYCVDNNLMEAILELKPFLKNIKKLRKTPFIHETFGEDIEKVLQFRTVLAQYLNLYTKDYLYKLKLQFACWIFFSKKYSQTYAPLHLIKYFCSEQNIDLEDMFEVLVRHPHQKQLFTSRELRNCEVSIEKWLDKATCLDAEEPKPSPDLDKVQNKAIEHIITSPCSILQGNAGCGKTTTICEVISQLISAKVNVIAAAFTHKAKLCIEKRIKDAGLEKNVITGTVHAIITFLSSCSLNNVFLILDESSMLDIELLGQLSYAMMNKNIPYQLCFVGDYYQLQPVGKGELFRLMVESNYNVTTLTKCYRTNFHDLFNAFEKVRSGQVPHSSEHFKLEILEDDAKISSFVGKFIYKHLDDAQIICWQNKHMRMINTWVQGALVKASKIGPEKFKNFYKNDKVVYTGENTEQITNAMTGVVIDVSNDGMIIEWSNQTRCMYHTMEDIYLSYCISAHKSQGSEYKNVLVVCYENEKMNKCLDKRWLYTSITRGQHHVTLVTTKKIEEFIKKPLNKIPFHNIIL